MVIIRGHYDVWSLRSFVLMVIYQSSLTYGVLSVKTTDQLNSELCITAEDQKKTLYGISSCTMFFEWGNEGKVWESCTSYAIIRVITVRVIRSLLYFLSYSVNRLENL